MTLIQVVLNGILLGGFYLLLSQGLNLVFGVMSIVNLAHGAFVVLGGLGVYAMWQSGVNPFVGMLIAIIVVAILGAVVQGILIERVRGKGMQKELLTLLATFGLSNVLINFGQRAWGSDYRTIPYMQSSIQIGALRFSMALIVGVVLAACFALVTALLLNKTRAGKSLLATAQNPVGAATCGINPKVSRLVGFSAGAALAAAAGTLLVLTQPIAPQMSTHFTIIAFVVIALGGLGNQAGAAMGALLVGVVQTVCGYYLGSIVQEAAPYLMLILLMLLRPRGLRTVRTA